MKSMWWSGRISLAVLAMATLGAASARAADDYCLDQRSGRVDVQATNAFRQLERTASQALMRVFNGVWYHRIRNPNTGQIDDNFQRFQSNGIWDYQDRVCSANGFCTNYAGTGLYAVRANPRVQNGFAGMIVVSDQRRNHQCVGLNGRFLNGNAFVDSTNTVSQRVR